MSDDTWSIFGTDIKKIYVILGIVGVAVVLLVTIIGIVICVCKCKKKKKNIQSGDGKKVKGKMAKSNEGAKNSTPSQMNPQQSSEISSEKPTEHIRLSEYGIKEEDVSKIIRNAGLPYYNTPPHMKLQKQTMNNQQQPGNCQQTNSYFQPPQANPQRGPNYL
uniref:Uncharacterized protein n=1 Tax=Strongyloides stercoralis TaxID=6248 RepID=A0A0K0DSF5_STRER